MHVSLLGRAAFLLDDQREQDYGVHLIHFLLPEVLRHNLRRSMSRPGLVKSINNHMEDYLNSIIFIINTMNAKGFACGRRGAMLSVHIV